jgi:TonB family protein
VCSLLRSLSLQLVVAVLCLSTNALAQEKPSPSTPEKPVIAAPRLKKFVEAVYPEGAVEAGLEAAVGLTVVVTEEGGVGEIVVTAPAGHGFDEAAVAAVKQFEFEPATLDGQPVPVRIGYTYRFKLEKKAVKKEPGQVVTGKVKEKGTGLPVIGAEVTLEGRARVTTDRKGGFRLREIEPGSYQLFVTHSEYKTLETPLAIEEGKQVEAELLLEPLVESPYEIVVRGKKEEAVVTRYVLEQRTLETVPGTFGDPIRVVETLPGVARSSFASSMLIIRGAMPGDSNVYIDGVPVPLLYHFFNGPSVLNPNFLESIEYYPGNFPARYGDAIAGIVDVEAKRRAVDGWSGEVDINLLNAAGYLEGPIGEKAGFRVGARRSYVDGVIAAALAISGEEGMAIAPAYYDMQAQLYFNPDARNTLSLLWVGSHDAIDLVAEGEEEEDTDISLATRQDFHRIILDWKHVGEKYSVKVRPFWGFDGLFIDTKGIDVDIDVHWVGGRAEAEYRPWDWLTIKPGTEAGAVIGDFSGQIPVPREYYIPGEQVSGVGWGRTTEVMPMKIGDDFVVWSSYLELQVRPWQRLNIIPGFHGELYQHSGGNIWMWDPRLAVRLDVGGGVTLKGGVGRYSMAPDPQYTDDTYGNPDLSYQWAMHYSGGVEWQFRDWFSVDLLGFYVRRYDLAVSTAAVETKAGEVEQTMATNDGWGRSYGMEAMLRFTSTQRFYGWIAYTLSRTELAGFAETGGTQAQADQSNELTLSPWDQTHILSAVGSVKLGRGWETGLRVRLVSGNPTTPIIGSRYVGDSSYYLPVTGTPYSGRLDPFFQVDVRVEKTWTFERWLLSLYLDIQNVTNHSNSEFEIWDYRFRESWVVPGIPFLPSLGISGRF